MDSSKINLEGSPLRDSFRLWHKQMLDQDFYACDGDLFLVDLRTKKIIALLDVKHFNDPAITPTEDVAYENFNNWGIPVFIVLGNWQTIRNDGVPKAVLVSPQIPLNVIQHGKKYSQVIHNNTENGNMI